MELLYAFNEVLLSCLLSCLLGYLLLATCYSMRGLVKILAHTTFLIIPLTIEALGTTKLIPTRSITRKSPT